MAGEKSCERVSAELEEALTKLDSPSVYFEKLRNDSALDEWYPELKALIGVMQNRNYHTEGDTWVHTMLVLDEAAKRRNIVKNPLCFMLSALCHDFGKAVCTEEVNGEIHAYKHETAGLPVVEKFLDRLGYDERIKVYVLNMTKLHMQPNILAGAGSKLKSTNKLFDSSAEPFDLIQLSICDGLGKTPPNDDSEPFLMERYKQFREIMAREYVTRDDLLDSGICEADVLDEVTAYAHKLRLAGIEKENALTQCISYARSLIKINAGQSCAEE